MVKITSGNSLSAASAIASCMSATPWPVDPVAARAPVAAAPSAMFTPSISVSAWIITPPTGSSAARERVEQSGERQHRIAREEAAPDVDRRLGDRVVALAEHERHGQLTSLRSARSVVVIEAVHLEHVVGTDVGTRATTGAAVEERGST